MASILIIQHRDVVRALFREVLERAGHDVRDASQGHDGIAQYRLFPTDLVISDVHMPDSKDLEVIVRLRHEFPSIKILAVSADPRKEDILAMSELLGADAVLPDAFNGEALLEAVEGLRGGS